MVPERLKEFKDDLIDMARAVLDSDNGIDVDNYYPLMAFIEKYVGRDEAIALDRETDAADGYVWWGNDDIQTHRAYGPPSFYHLLAASSAVTTDINDRIICESKG